MWNLSKDGFVSVVAYDPKKDRDSRSPFPGIAKQSGTHLLVRARRMEHLEPLRKVVPNMVIVDDRHADYRFRAVIKRDQYKQVLSKQVDEITYWSHFKEACRDAQPEHLKSSMYSAVMKIWSIMAGLQASAPYKGDERKDAPAHKSVADYQAERGVKPFKSTQEQSGQLPMALFSAPTVQKYTPLSSTSPTSGGEIDTDALVELIAKKHDLQFTSEQLARMSDDAFEIVTRIGEKYGAKMKPSSQLVEKVRAEVEGANAP